MRFLSGLLTSYRENLKQSSLQLHLLRTNHHPQPRQVTTQPTQSSTLHSSTPCPTLNHMTDTACPPSGTTSQASRSRATHNDQRTLHPVAPAWSDSRRRRQPSSAPGTSQRVPCCLSSGLCGARRRASGEVYMHQGRTLGCVSCCAPCMQPCSTMTCHFPQSKSIRVSSPLTMSNDVQRHH